MVKNIENLELVQEAGEINETQAIGSVVIDTKNQVNNINNPDYDKQNIVTTRLYHLRHLPYKETQEYKEYNSLLKRKTNGQTLTIEEKSQMKLLANKLVLQGYEELEDRLKRVFAEIINDTEDTLFIFDEDENSNPNVSKTGKIISGKLKNKISKNIIKMPRTDKSNSFGDNMILVSENFNEVVKIIKSKIVEKKYKKIVLIGNRSFAHEFELKLIGNSRSSVETSAKKFKEQGFLIADFNEKGNLIKGEHLVITPDNYREILEDVKENIPARCIDMIDLQNYINTDFKKHNELLMKHLHSKNKDLMLFCFKLLFENGRTNTLEELIYMGDIDENSLKEIFRILTEKKDEDNNIIVNNLNKKIQVSGAVNNINLVQNKSKVALWKFVGVKLLINENIDFKEEFGISEDNEQEIYAEKSKIDNISKISQNNINSIFDRSLDTLIKKGEGIIERRKRKTYSNGYDIEETDENSHQFVKIEEILEDRKCATHIISDNVGEGKSVELAGFARRISESNKYEVVYITAKDIIDKRIPNLDNLLIHYTELFQVYFNKKVIFIIDGFDELSNNGLEEYDYKAKMKQIIKSTEIFDFNYEKSRIDKNLVRYGEYGYKGKPILIIGSRKGEFDKKSDKNISIYSFEPINDKERNEFISSRLANLIGKKGGSHLIEEKTIEINQFIESGIIDDDIKNTPLILYLICEYASINELRNINNRARLYEEVIRGIMRKHNSESSDIIIDHNMDDLGTIAYHKFAKKNEIELSEKEIKKYNKLKNIDIKRLSVLFKIPGDKNSAFIHNSFYEFFLARHIARNGLAENIYNHRELNKENWNKWKRMNPIIQFLGEIHINEEEYDELAQLIGEEGLLKKDDLYGEGFFNGLELLIKLSSCRKSRIKVLEKLKNIYIGKINNFDKTDIINKLSGFVLLQSKVGYAENDFVLEFFEKIIAYYDEIRLDLEENNEQNSLNGFNNSILQLGINNAIMFMDDKIREVYNGIHSDTNNKFTFTEKYFSEEEMNTNINKKYTKGGKELNLFKEINRIFNLALETSSEHIITLSGEHILTYFSLGNPVIINRLQLLYFAGNKQVGERLMAEIDELLNVGNYNLGIEILENMTIVGNIDIITKLINESLKLISVGRYEFGIKILSRLAKKGNKDAHGELIRIVENQYDNNKLFSTGEIFIELLLMGKSEYKDKLKICVDKWKKRPTIYGCKFILKFIMEAENLGEKLDKKIIEIYIKLKSNQKNNYDIEKEIILFANKGIINDEDIINNLQYLFTIGKYQSILAIFIKLKENGILINYEYLLYILNYLKLKKEYILIDKYNEGIINIGGENICNFYYIFYENHYKGNLGEKERIKRLVSLSKHSYISAVEKIYENIDEYIAKYPDIIFEFIDLQTNSSINEKGLNKIILAYETHIEKSKYSKKDRVKIWKIINTIAYGIFYGLNIIEFTQKYINEILDDMFLFIGNDDDFIYKKFIELIQLKNSSIYAIIINNLIANLLEGRYSKQFMLKMLYIISYEGDFKKAFKLLEYNIIDLYEKDENNYVYGKIIIEIIKKCPADQISIFKNFLEEVFNNMLEKEEYFAYIKLNILAIKELDILFNFDINYLAKMIKHLTPSEQIIIIGEFKQLNIYIPDLE